MNSTEKTELLFTQLILMFQTAALQQMGKLKNPVSDAIERDLAQAQISIDLLEMLRTKSKGNLSVAEEKILSNVLQELKLNYVDEVSKSQAPPPQQPPEGSIPS